MTRENPTFESASMRREQQHAAVAELGRLALAGYAFEDLCKRAVQDLSDCLNLRFVKLLKLSSDRSSLKVSFGRGWKDGIVGQARVPNNEESQAGYTLQTAETVVVEDFSKEERFTSPQLLRDHGITCGASVVIGPLADPWGVLGVHENEFGRCRFDEYDVAFIKSVANLLWLHWRNEQSRKSSERERSALRSFADAMPILLAILDAEERYEYVNKAYESLGDLSSFIGKHVEEVAGSATYASAKPFLQRAFSGEAVRFETRLDIRGAESRDMLVTYAPRRGDDGTVDGVYAAVVDVTDQKRRQRDEVERVRQFQAIADSIPYGVWMANAEGKLTYVSDSFLRLVGMSFQEARDFGWINSLLPEEAETTRLAWEACLEKRGNWEREHKIVGADNRHYSILAIARPIFGDDGELLSYVGLNLDITDRKKREETLRLLARELDHRVQNVFALVSTIARMSSRRVQNVDDFRASFEARIRALSSAHGLLGKGDWEGMSLRDLLLAELAPYAVGQVNLQGPDVVLCVQSVQSLALCFHELTTNAAKYGALANEGGRLDISWQETNDGAVIDWKESGLTDLQPPQHQGFGSTVVEKMLGLQLDGEVSVSYHLTGIQVRISLPSTCIERL